jgi:hypothetical protein
LPTLVPPYFWTIKLMKKGAEICGAGEGCQCGPSDLARHRGLGK